MIRNTTYLLIGGGIASSAAVQTLIAEGASGSDILLVSGDTELPYDRPPLSKKYLAGTKDRTKLFLEPPDFYTENDITTQLTTWITELHAKDRAALTSTGDTIRFDSALLATGGRPRHLTLPGSEYKNIFYLRTLADSDAIKAASQAAKRAVIVGGGFIGLEAAATLRGKGLDVTVLHRGERLLDRFAAPPIAQFFHDAFSAQGVHIRYNVSADHFTGTDQMVTAVVTDSGETLPADIVIVGIGVELVTDYMKDSALQIENGVLVDEELQTAVPGIFAAGDIANFPDQIFGGKRRRIEHWDHALATGKTAAKNMLGKGDQFSHLSYFFSDMFDLSFELWGDTDAPDEVVFQGDLATKTAASWYLRNGSVSAYFAINRPDAEKDRAQSLITRREHVTKADFASNK